MTPESNGHQQWSPGLHRCSDIWMGHTMSERWLHWLSIEACISTCSTALRAPSCKKKTHDQSTTRVKQDFSDLQSQWLASWTAEDFLQSCIHIDIFLDQHQYYGNFVANGAEASNKGVFPIMFWICFQMLWIVSVPFSWHKQGCKNLHKITSNSYNVQVGMGLSWDADQSIGVLSWQRCSRGCGGY